MACHEPGPTSGSDPTEVELIKANQRISDLAQDLKERGAEQDAEVALLRMKIDELQSGYLKATRVVEELQIQHSQLLEEHRDVKTEVALLHERNTRLETLLQQQAKEFSGVVADDTGLQQLKEANRTLLHERNPCLEGLLNKQSKGFSGVVADDTGLHQLKEANRKLKEEVSSLRNQVVSMHRVRQSSPCKSDEGRSFPSSSGCPNRKATTIQSAGPGISLHDALWELVRSMHGVALLCRCTDLVITHVSKPAFAFFGSRARRGANVGILANEEASKALLTQAIETWGHVGNSFWVQEILGVDFATSRGVVDCAVVFVRLPADAHFTKQASILLLVTPVRPELAPMIPKESAHDYGLSKATFQRMLSRDNNQRPKRNSCRSEVSAAPSGASQSDINPNDSVSNVGAFCRDYH